MNERIAGYLKKIKDEAETLAKYSTSIEFGYAGSMRIGFLVDHIEEILKEKDEPVEPGMRDEPGEKPILEFTPKYVLVADDKEKSGGSCDQCCFYVKRTRFCREKLYTNERCVNWKSKDNNGITFHWEIG